MAVWVGVDLGGTHLRAAAWEGEPEDAPFRLLGHTLRTTPLGRDEVLAAVRDAVADTAAGRQICGIGVGAPGAVDAEAGILLLPPNMPGCERLPLGSALHEAFAAPVTVENDANAAAVGEHREGSGHGGRNMLYITFSTGIGAGTILEGHLHRGATGTASEIGHMVVNPSGPSCGCGNRGCWEQFASGTALARLGRTAAAADRSPMLLQLAGKVAAVRAEHVVEAARRGDSAAIEALSQVSFYAGVGLLNVLHVLDPGVVVIGGGLAQAWDEVFVPAIAWARQHAFPPVAAGTRFLPASLGDNAGVLGAARLVAEACRPSGARRTGVRPHG